MGNTPSGTARTITPVQASSSICPTCPTPIYDKNTCKNFITSPKLGLNYNPVNQDVNSVMTKMQAVFDEIQPYACNEMGQRLVDTIAKFPVSFSQRSNFGFSSSKPTSVVTPKTTVVSKPVNLSGNSVTQSQTTSNPTMYIPSQVQDAATVKLMLTGQLQSIAMDSSKRMNMDSATTLKIVNAVSILINNVIDLSTVNGKIDIVSAKNLAINIIASVCPNVKIPTISKSSFGNSSFDYISNIFFLFFIFLIVIYYLYTQGKLPWLKELFCGKTLFGKRR